MSKRLYEITRNGKRVKLISGYGLAKKVFAGTVKQPNEFWKLRDLPRNSTTPDPAQNGESK